jgi:hypothetical protein
MSATTGRIAWELWSESYRNRPQPGIATLISRQIQQPPHIRELPHANHPQTGVASPNHPQSGITRMIVQCARHLRGDAVVRLLQIRRGRARLFAFFTTLKVLTLNKYSTEQVDSTQQEGKEGYGYNPAIKSAPFGAFGDGARSAADGPGADRRRQRKQVECPRATTELQLRVLQWTGHHRPAEPLRPSAVLGADQSQAFPELG